jgi:hypothetical protein
MVISNEVKNAIAAVAAMKLELKNEKEDMN